MNTEGYYVPESGGLELEIADEKAAVDAKLGGVSCGRARRASFRTKCGVVALAQRVPRLFR